MQIYQFLIAIRQGNPNSQAMTLTNADGETTSHIQGIFNRTIRLLTEGIRPVYVFDGKPPQMKSGELLKRREQREKAEEALKVATESGNIEEQNKQNKRLVRAGTKESEDCMRLLQLMGVPVIKAPCEAEAQAAALCKAGKVYATATEDMDALTFQTPIQVRKMTFAKSDANVQIQQLNYDKALLGLEINHDQFVDLCILMGCDYCDTIKGIGPKTALKLIKEHKNIETILKNLNREKHVVPESYEPMKAKKREEKEKKKKAAEASEGDSDNEGDEEVVNENVANGELKKDDEEEDEVVLIPAFVEARRLFNEHEVMDNKDVDLKWKPCQPEPLKAFLVDEMGFNPDRVQASIEKLQKAHKSSSKPQARMDSFFAVKKDPEKDAKRAAKRKAEKEAEKKAKKNKGKKKVGGFAKR